MTHVTAVLSFLHEAPGDCESATRMFRSQPVLWWTLERLSRSARLDAVAMLCWEDQVERIAPIAEEHDAYILAKGPRHPLPAMSAVTAARRWADGWRGGLLGACDFDLGFHARWIADVLAELHSNAAVLVDPASGLVDPRLIDGLIEHAIEKPSQGLVFMPAAPGFGGALVRAEMLPRLEASGLHPGRLLHYQPENPSRDPLTTEACAPAPTPLMRTTHRFKLDSDRQVRRLTAATVSLNGQLVSSEGEEILARVGGHPPVDMIPREVTLELTTQRAAKPIHSPVSSLTFDRSELPIDTAKNFFEQLAALDDVRLTLAGVGDPLLHGEFAGILRAAADAGIRAIHVETDLLSIDREKVEALADLPIDIITVHMSALSPAMYREVMGVDGLAEVIGNLEVLLNRRAKLARGTPLVVPTFTKCGINLVEMEPWYDQWLRALGAAVIVGPSDYCGLLKDVSIADMRPPARRACARLASRMMVLSDGKIVSCEQDILARRAMGNIGIDAVADIWRDRFQSMYRDHVEGNWAKHPLCASCKEWHRP